MARVQRSISAAELLRTYDPTSLQQMARKQGIDPKSLGKGKLVGLLCTMLYDPARVATALNDLEPTERHVLERLVLMGGEALTVSLRQQLGADGKIDAPEPSRRTGLTTGGSAAARGSRRFEDIIARLGVLGLVFTTNSRTYKQNVEITVPGQYLFIPDAILKNLPAVTIELETAPPPAIEEAGYAGALLRDLYALLSFARHEPIPLTTRGQIPKRTLIQIDSAFQVHEDMTGVRSESDLGRLPFLRALAEDAQLLLESATGLRLGDKPLEFLGRSPGRRQRQLYDVYRRTRRWSELTRLRGISVTPRDRMTSPGIVNARKRVLAEVAELPACQWIPAAHLIDRIRQRAFEFLLERDWSYSHYYYGSSYYSDPDPYWGNNSLGLSFRHRDSTSAKWDEVEGGFIRAVLEALHWLGIVDFGRTDAEGAISFRTTEAGAALLHDSTPQSAVPNPHVVVQPNFQIFAFEPTGEDVLFTLDRIAERVRVEQVVEYRLSRESVYAAQRDGVDITFILDFLDRVSSAPLPQNVRRSLEEWGAQHERIVMQRGISMVQTLDAALLDSLYDDPELRPLLGRRLTGTAALVSAQNLPILHNRLMASGTHPLPTISEGDDSFRQPAVNVDDDGRIRLRQQVPSMYVVAALRQFTDNVDGELRVTPAALRRAVGRDQAPPLKVEDIIATMERFQVGTLPEAVVALVRRWAKDWGRGALLEVALLQVESPEIMADLLTDAELKPYLHPVLDTAALAAIPPNRLERVRSLLRGRGMRLGDKLFAPDGGKEKGG